jgi:hypothetical protein
VTAVTRDVEFRGAGSPNWERFVSGYGFSHTTLANAGEPPSGAGAGQHRLKPARCRRGCGTAEAVP